MSPFTARELKFFATLMALTATVALVATVWSIIQVLTSDPAASWWTVALGVAFTAGIAAAAVWFRREAVKASGGAA